MRNEFLSAVFCDPASSPVEGARIKDLVWFTGKDVERYDFWTGEEWILRLPMDKVSLDRMSRGAPLMRKHERPRSVDNQVGVFERAWIENGIGKGTVRFSDTEDAEQIWQKVASGIVRNVSMEISIADLKNVSQRGDKIKTFEATSWEVEAVALVPVGADEAAQFMALGDHSPIPSAESQAEAAEEEGRQAEQLAARKRHSELLALIART